MCQTGLVTDARAECRSLIAGLRKVVAKKITGSKEGMQPILTSIDEAVVVLLVRLATVALAVEGDGGDTF